MSIHLGDDDELPAATPHSGVVAAADYYRRPERDTADYRQSNVDRTQKAASDVLARTSAARWFAQISQDTEHFPTSGSGGCLEGQDGGDEAGAALWAAAQAA